MGDNCCRLVEPARVEASSSKQAFLKNALRADISASAVDSDDTDESVSPPGEMQIDSRESITRIRVSLG